MMAVGGESRFRFGENWQRFLKVVDEERIEVAETSLRAMLEVESLAGRSFLDVGSGSGLFSLAAVRLGAERVHSFDYDPRSVECTGELKRRYCGDAAHWTIEQGSVLDGDYVRALGHWDVVYSWGVLHHTGDMWRALEIMAGTVKPDGVLLIALYNDQGWRSVAWRQVKRFYNLGVVSRWLTVGVFVPYFVVRLGLDDLSRLENPLRRYRTWARGMTPVRDWADWLGGYPFEVARPQRVVEFCRHRDFVLERQVLRDKSGCNEFVFRRR
jgi:SAM-dependent methyltransferase